MQPIERIISASSAVSTPSAVVVIPRLRAIASEVDEIDSLVGEMAASTQEQALSLAGVNTTMNHMDQVTQQNAAMVEETTAASHALAQEATRLAQRMGELRISAEARSAAAA